MRHSSILIRASVFAFLLAAPALGQNDANTCNQAPLVGDGVYPFDTTGATASGVEPDAGMCEDFGQGNPASMNKDIWFEWIPDTNGDYRFSTCDDANYDSKIAVYAGSCGSLIALGCDDDGPCSGFTSQLDLTGFAAGTTYFVQVGGYASGSVGTGNLTIEPQGSTGGGVGPDIAVSGVGNNDFINYGTSGGIRAYSFATTSCNVGDAVVNWYSGIGNDHPLIAQNLFRIDGGRIEQLGYSFLKHGFCAVNENSCGSCQSTSCDTLGLGCADTYSAGLNDGDNGASKRSVNATLGTYSGNPGPVGDNSTINGRLQVQDSELTGIVIAESQYVSEHDHGAGLARNNASWRRVSVSGNGNLSGNGSVQMFDPGIFAWEALGGATVNEVVNIDEGGPDIHGYFFVGYKVTDLGGGQWRYEYAVQNFNSDRSGQGFEVPLPAGLIPTSVFFRDLHHHSGDPYSDADWSYSSAGDVARWETQTFSQNPDANALRWGTLYNFGFTANGAPQAVTAAITLFKPGMPSSLTTTVMAPSGGGIIDCNGNGVDDSEDIASGVSQDCNSNSIPDECDPDCDGDDIPDDCEADCDGDGTPDDCEDDCDSDGTPDDCEDDCDGDGTPDDCEPDCDSDGTPDDCEPDCDNDGTPDDCEVDCDNDGTPDDCEPDCDSDGTPDDCEPDCDSDGIPDDCEADCNGNGTPDECESFTDCNSNSIPDECEPDCDADGLPDDCEEDCNGNGIPDDCESLGDCDGDGLPDACEPDCDNDGLPDDCEEDCNGNGMPDDCEGLPDCDRDGTPDECEPDCDNDGLPDDCEEDCNGNGTPDDCETLADCDADGVPDDCEPDCDNDGLPDDCETDCNGNGMPDDCETLADCNSNGVPDDCDISGGTSSDGDGNGVPDECEVISSNFGFCTVGPCGNADPTSGCANSSGGGAGISAQGSGSVSNDNLTLAMSPVPVNNFGVFFAGASSGAGFPFGDGVRVVVGAVNRFPVENSGPTGEITFGQVVSFANANFPITGHISAGSTWNFQGWYRDPAGPCGSGFNLTHGMSVLFTP